MFVSRRNKGGGKLKEKAIVRKQIQDCINGTNSVNCILDLIKNKCKSEKYNKTEEIVPLPISIEQVNYDIDPIEINFEYPEEIIEDKVPKNIPIDPEQVEYLDELKGGARQLAQKCSTTTCLLKLLTLKEKINKTLRRKNNGKSVKK